MNILYTGYYRDNTGYGYAGQDYIRALKTTGHGVAIRAFCNTITQRKNLPTYFKRLEKTYFDKKPDVVIQHYLPHSFEFISGAKNIGITHIENRHLNMSTWINHMNILDELWVATEREKITLEDSGVKVPIIVIPMPIDTTPSLTTIEPQVGSGYTFYTIGEFVERKNLSALVMAFHREFGRTEPVNLVIKTGHESLANAEEQVQKFLFNMKKSLRLYSDPRLYKSEGLIAHRISHEEIKTLHKTLDCLVIPSRGESTCRPVLDAMVYGNPIIVTEGIGPESLDANIFKAKSYESPVLNDNDKFQNIHTGRETWMEVDIIDLQKQMRHVYETRPTFNYDVEKFSYETVGRAMNARF